jgi:hypothetical protein
MIKSCIDRFTLLGMFTNCKTNVSIDNVFTTQQPSQTNCNKGKNTMLNHNFSRRTLLRGLVAACWALSLPKLGITATGKAGKQQAGYQSTPKGEQKCDNCEHFLSPKACSLVEGDISPQGWCKLWHKKQ